MHEIAKVGNQINQIVELAGWVNTTPLVWELFEPFYVHTRIGLKN